jgi:hypothetical protein
MALYLGATGFSSPLIFSLATNLTSIFQLENVVQQVAISVNQRAVSQCLYFLRLCLQQRHVVAHRKQLNHDHEPGHLLPFFSCVVLARFYRREAYFSDMTLTWSSKAGGQGNDVFIPSTYSRSCWSHWPILMVPIGSPAQSTSHDTPCVRLHSASFSRMKHVSRYAINESSSGSTSIYPPSLVE